MRHFFLHVAIGGLDGGWHRGALTRPQTLAADPLLGRIADRCETSSDVRWAEALEHAAFAAWCAGLPSVLAQALRRLTEAPDPLAPALRLIEDGFAGPLPVSALARACLISEDTLNRQMRARFGKTPAAWIRRRRCALAAERLADSALPIEDIARGHGFANRHHFTRIFTRVMGCGPAEHRRLARAWRA